MFILKRNASKYIKLLVYSTTRKYELLNALGREVFSILAVN